DDGSTSTTDIELDIKPDVDVKPDIKPDIGNKDQSSSKAKKNQSESSTIKSVAVESWLLKLFGSHDIIHAIRTDTHSKKGKPAKLLWTWVEEVGSLHELYPRAVVAGIVAVKAGNGYSDKGALVTWPNWAALYNRGEGWVQKCVAAYKYIHARQNEEDIKKFLAESTELVGVERLQEIVKGMAWVK
ncbi:hypothetical protein C8J57DRAFT_1328006, partial [Mycena rebaudengoi]